MNNAQYPQMLSRKKLPKAKKGDMDHFPKAITLHPKAKHVLENYSRLQEETSQSRVQT
jgi:hypothetical protein